MRGSVPRPGLAFLPSHGYAAAVLLAVAAFWYWPTDRRRIIAAGRQLAEAVSVPATEPDLARVTRAAVLSRLLAPGVRLVGPGGRVAIADLDPSFGAAGRTATSRTTVTMREPGADGAPGRSTPATSR